MTTDTPLVPAASAAISPAALSTSVRWQTLFYLGGLIVLLGFGTPFQGLIDIPISFFLKNKLHLQAHEVATFRLIAALPLSVLGFLFGFARDTWNPFGLKDRGFIILFSLICALTFGVFAFIPVTYMTLLIAVILSTTSYLFVWAAQNGLTSALGQQHVMSGQVSAMWNAFGQVPGLASFLAGGILSDGLEGKNPDQAGRTLFLVGAAIMVATALYGFWKPAIVFDNVHTQSGGTAQMGQNFKRLARHWPIYPALLIWLLWNFAPGSQTPLQFYLQNTLHANDSQWGEWNAIFAGSFVPTFLLFGFLCRKYPLKTLLFWGTVIAVPQMVPLLFVHSVNGALISAAFLGLMGGVSSAAYMDLLIRSCPPGLEGTVLMASWGLYFVASRFGDVLGTYLYERFGGFTVCVTAITIVYALILPILLLVPKRLTATRDGEAIEGA